MALSAVITELGKRRIAEVLQGAVSSASSPQPIRPVFFRIGKGGAGINPKAPDSFLTALEDPLPYQQALSTVGAGMDINPALAPAFQPESTLQFHLLVPANTMPVGTYVEFGVFIQFGTNPLPDLFVYGTFTGILNTQNLEFNISVKI